MLRSFGVMAALLGLLSGWMVPVCAAEEETVKMGEVVVTASRQAEQTTRVPANVTVIEAEQIEKTNAQNVPEVLQSVGLHVSDVMGNKRTYSIDLRGFGESAPQNMLVLVDGRRITQPDLSAADWTLIPLERIARIEIIPGSRGGVFYGDNATGGVINIITKEGQPGMEGTAEVQYGSYETFKGSAGLNGAGDIFSYNILGSYYNTDGYRDNSAREATDFGANMRWDPNETLGFDLSGGYHQDTTGMPGPLSQSDLESGIDRTATNTPDDYADTKDYYAKGGLELFFLSNDSFKLDTSVRRRDVVWYATFGGFSSEYNTIMDSVSVSPLFSFNEDFGDVSNRLILGADFSGDNLNVPDSFGGTSDLKKQSTGFYVNDDLAASDKLSFSGGYRYESAEYNLSDSVTSDRYDFNEEAFSLGINYLVGPAKLFANYGKGYRYPNLDELYDATYYSYMVLDPQVSHSWEVGTSISLHRNISLTLNFFSINTEQEIFYDPGAGLWGANTNLDGETDRKGVELGVVYEHKGWSMGADYKYTHATIKGGQYDGKRVPSVPYNLGSANLGYTFGNGLFVGLSGVYVGSRFFISDFDNAYDELDPYTVVNARIDYPWRWLDFYLDFNNILNEKYSSYGTISGGERQYYTSPEFNMLAGIRARFGGR